MDNHILYNFWSILQIGTDSAFIFALLGDQRELNIYKKTLISSDI